ncbi:MAG: hypothetical protein HYZ53_19765 [Planctomycetes bacterium]|nr:hypothetical protein [Planctomycetota bacterium]
MTAAAQRRPVASVTKHEAILLLALTTAAAVARLAGLPEQGFRLPDEGNYAFLGLALLQGLAKAVWLKPGQALLLAGAYQVFGASSVAAFMPAALLGSLQVPATWLLARRLWGPVPALVAAASFATLPFALLYGRSALSDASYLCIVTAGLALAAWALPLREDEATAPPRPARGAAGWAARSGAGFLLGFAFWTNPAASVPAGFAFAAALLLAAAGRTAWRDLARSLWGAAAGAVLATAAVAASGGDAIDWGRRSDALVVPARIILAFAPSTVWAERLWQYAGPELLALALVGACSAARRRTTGDLFALAFAGGLLLFYARTDHPSPRIYFPLSLPVVLLAGLGGEHVAAWLAARFAAGARRTVAIGLSLACALVPLLAWHGREAFSLESGLPQVCELLRGEGGGKVSTSEHCWTYVSFVGNCQAFPDSVAIMKDLANAPEPDAVERRLARLRGRGYTHWVVDAMFWMRAEPAALDRLRRFLETHPPLARIPHPVAAHRATALECTVPAAADDPAARWIYVYRLKDLDLQEPGK